MDSYDSYFKYVCVDALKQKKEEKTPEEMLSMLNAGYMENGIFHFNNAGALFFAKDITKFNVPHEIKMPRFKIHRNKQICDIFSKTTYMEHYGTGIQRMKDKMPEEKLKEPEFEEVGEFFKVTLWARSEEDINPDLYKTNVEPLDELGLNERQIKAYTLIVNGKKTFTIKNYLECFKISKPIALKNLNMMVELGLAIKSKKGRSNVYSAT